MWKGRGGPWPGQSVRKAFPKDMLSMQTLEGCVGISKAK